MDELMLLRKLRDEVEEPTVAELAAGRESLLRSIEALSTQKALSDQKAQSVSAPRHHIRRMSRRRTIAIISASVATVAAAAIVISIVAPVGTPLGASPAAAAVLQDAATATITASDPVVGPGQYLKISTTEVALSMGPAQESWLSKEVRDLYVPHTSDDVWVWQRSVPEGQPPYVGATAQADAESFYQRHLDDPFYGTLRAPKGAFYPESNGFAPWAAGYSPDQLKALPRDPQALLDELYREGAGHGQSQGQMTLELATEILSNGLAPADLRAALYRAIALIPDVTVVDTSATMDGRTGVAIGRVEPSTGDRRDLIVDPHTGELIGVREIATRTSGIIPAGEIIDSQSIVTSVVDSAP